MSEILEKYNGFVSRTKDHYKEQWMELAKQKSMSYMAIVCMFVKETFKNAKEVNFGKNDLLGSYDVEIVTRNGRIISNNHIYHLSKKSPNFKFIVNNTIEIQTLGDGKRVNNDLDEL